jgi:hypothetical protein
MSWLAMVRAWPTGMWPDRIALGAAMTKPKTWVDLARSLGADWPPSQTMTITDLVAEARAAEWDFTLVSRERV